MTGHGLLIEYACKGCGVDKSKVRVRYRVEREDIRSWFEGVVMGGVARDHRRRSPGCPASHADVKIPMEEGAEGIGMRGTD